MIWPNTRERDGYEVTRTCPWCGLVLRKPTPVDKFQCGCSWKEE